MMELSYILRSPRLDIDFELLLKSPILTDVLVDGFATDEDYEQGIVSLKRASLRGKLQDFVDCMDYLDHARLHFRRRGINKHWGTSSRLLALIEHRLGRTISHGALLLALDLRGMALQKIIGRKDAYMGISDKSTFS